MKIYNPPKIEAPLLMRVNIKKQGYKTEFLTLCEVTQSKCLYFVAELIKEQNLSPFGKGKVTNVEIREGKGALNGKSVSLSFKGLDPNDVKELIIKELEKKEKDSTIKRKLLLLG